MNRSLKYLAAPLLFSLYTSLSLYARNLDILNLRQLIVPLFFAFALAVIILGLFRIVFRDMLAASIAASVFLIIFWNYIVVFNIFNHFHSFSNWDVFRITLFLYLIFLLLLGGLKEKINFENLNKIFVGAGSVLIGFYLVLIVSGEVKKYQTGLPASAHRILYEKGVKSGYYPDIYLLIFDEYARLDTIKEKWGYDNSEFAEFLEDRGFYLAGKSEVNHLQTRKTLVEIFNLRHIERKKSWDELIALQYGNYLFSYLEERGYRITYLDGYETHSRPFLVENIKLLTYADFLRGREFHRDTFFQMLYLKTLLYPLDFFTNIEEKISIDYYLGNLGFINYLKNIPGKKKVPHFVLAHVECPHWPYEFDRDGNRRKDRSSYWMFPGMDPAKIKEHYLDQYIYVTKEIQNIIKAVQSKNKEAVMIIISDHGPRTNTTGIRDENQGYKVLNTVYFPDGDYSAMYENISLINTLRVVMNKYFGENYEMLKDSTRNE